MLRGMNWIVAVRAGRTSCEVPCSILAASDLHLESKRKSHVARLPCESSAQPDGETGPLVCQYRAHLCGNFSVDRLLSTDGGRNAATCRTSALPGGAGGGGNPQLCLVLSGSGDAGDEDRISAVRSGRFHVWHGRRLHHARAADGGVADW